MSQRKRQKMKKEEESIKSGPAFHVSHYNIRLQSEMNYTISDYSLMAYCDYDCYFNSTTATIGLLLILIFITNVCCLVKQHLEFKAKKVNNSYA